MHAFENKEFQELLLGSTLKAEKLKIYISTRLKSGSVSVNVSLDRINSETDSEGEHLFFRYRDVFFVVSGWSKSPFWYRDLFFGIEILHSVVQHLDLSSS